MIKSLHCSPCLMLMSNLRFQFESICLFTRLSTLCICDFSLIPNLSDLQCVVIPHFVQILRGVIGVFGESLETHSSDHSD